MTPTIPSYHYLRNTLIIPTSNELLALPELSVDQPHLIDSIDGFNIVEYQAQFIGIKQDLGPIDVQKIPDIKVFASQTMGFFVADSKEEIVCEIQGKGHAPSGTIMDVKPSKESTENALPSNLDKLGLKNCG